MPAWKVICLSAIVILNDINISDIIRFLQVASSEGDKTLQKISKGHERRHKGVCQKMRQVLMDQCKNCQVWCCSSPYSSDS